MGLLRGIPDVTGAARHRDVCTRAGTGAEERRSLSVMMPSSYYCRHCDADGHHTTVDTGIWISRDTVTLYVLAGGGPV